MAVRILCATDYGPGSVEALERAVALAAQEAGTVLLTHVVPQEPASPEIRASLQREHLVRLWKLECEAVRGAESPPIERLVVFGAPVSMLASVALRERASLVVLAVRRRRRLLGTRVSAALVRVAPCPVLQVPATALPGPAVPLWPERKPEPELTRSPLLSWPRRARSRPRVVERLQTLLEAEAAALEAWREARISAVQALASRPLVQDAVGSLVEAAELGDDAACASRAQLLLRRFLLPVCRAEGWPDFAVYLPDGRRIAALDDAQVGERVAEGAASTLSDAFTGRAGVSLPYRGEPVAGDWLGRGARLAQLAAAPVGAQPVAVLAVRMRAQAEVLRLVASASTGRTGETYLFDHRGMMLSGSRFEPQLRSLGLLPDDHEESAALNLRVLDPGGNLLEGHVPPSFEALPLTRMAQTATQGEGGLDVEGYRDYRGVEVVGAWTWFASAGFGLATEMDAAEAF